MKKYQDQILAICKEAEACIAENFIKPYTFCLFMEVQEQFAETREWVEEEIDGAFENCVMVLEIMSMEHERDREMIDRFARVLDEWKGTFNFQNSLKVV